MPPCPGREEEGSPWWLHQSLLLCYRKDRPHCLTSQGQESDGRWIIGGSVQSLVEAFIVPYWSSLHSFKAETKRPKT